MLEFGAEPRRAPFSVRLLASLSTDHRIVPLVAGLGAVSAFTSLVSEWQVTTVDGHVSDGAGVGVEVLTAGLDDLGSLGTGYVVGIFALAVAAALALLGPPTGRHYAHVTGLSVGATLTAVLLALTFTLRDRSRILPQIYTLQANGNGHITIAYGRGLWCGFFAVLAATAALYLSSRQSAAAGGQAPRPSGWSWRRTRTTEPDRGRPEPYELTVSATQPFTTATIEPDEPYRSGRSGKFGF